MQACNAMICIPSSLHYCSMAVQFTAGRLTRCDYHGGTWCGWHKLSKSHLTSRAVPSADLTMPVVSNDRDSDVTDVNVVNAKQSGLCDRLHYEL